MDTFRLTRFSGSPRFQLGAAAVFAVLIFFVNLGSDGMYAPQEGRTAIITRNMLISHNYLDMTVPGGVPYEKPVGHYWLCLPLAAAFGLDGEPVTSASEWALRLPSALSALIAVAAAAVLAARIYGTRCAAITMVVLSSMATFANLGRVAHIDMPLAAAYILAMLCLYLGYFERRRANAWLYGFYALLGWGMVLKGPVPVILAGLTVLLMAIRERSWRMLLDLRPFSGALVFLAVALPWYVAENFRTDGAFFNEFIINQNLRRFTGIGSTYRNGERMSYFYYFPKLFAGALPWSIFLVIGVIAMFRRVIRLQFRRESCYLIFMVAGAFVFFSLSALKRGDYLLPIYPALAILIARIIELGAERLPALHRGWIAVWGAIAALLAAATVLILTGVIGNVGTTVANREWRFMSRRDGMNTVMFCDFAVEHAALLIAAAAATALLLLIFGRLLARRRNFAAFALLAVLVLALFSFYHAVLQPGTDRLKTVKPLVREAAALLPPGARVLYLGDFNTELIYFVNHPYGTSPEEISGVDFIFATPEWFASQSPAFRTAWSVRLVTPEGHHYPAVLLCRVK